jgi:hypothetical protein
MIIALFPLLSQVLAADLLSYNASTTPERIFSPSFTLPTVILLLPYSAPQAITEFTNTALAHPAGVLFTIVIRNHPDYHPLRLFFNLEEHPAVVLYRPDPASAHGGWKYRHPSEITQARLNSFIQDCLSSRTPPFLQSSPHPSPSWTPSQHLPDE